MVLLNHNTFDKDYTCINTLCLDNFSQYGWTEGDKLLNEVVDCLQDRFSSSLVFRVHGDDFILITKEHLEIDINQFEHLSILEKHHISISKRHIDLREQDVPNIEGLEALIQKCF